MSDITHFCNILLVLLTFYMNMYYYYDYYYYYRGAVSLQADWQGTLIQRSRLGLLRSMM